jgi:predicted transcriptional regulator
MSIQKISSQEVTSISKFTSILEAVKLMKKNNVGTVIVVDQENNNPVGILTDRDIIIKIICDEVNPHDVSVGDVMNDDLLILKTYQDINECLEMMCVKKVRRAPIVDENNKLCGVVSMDDLLMLIADELSSLAKLVCKQATQ